MWMPLLSMVMMLTVVLLTIEMLLPCCVQAMSLCERSGLSREQYLGFINDFYPVPPVVGYATRIARDQLDAGTG